MTTYPVAKACPSCGGERYTKVKPNRSVYYAKDRICQACSTRYTPATPAWATGLFIVLGFALVLVGAAGVLAQLLVAKTLGCGAIFPALLIVMGAAAASYGFRASAQRRDAK